MPPDGAPGRSGSWKTKEHRVFELKTAPVNINQGFMTGGAFFMAGGAFFMAFGVF